MNQLNPDRAAERARLQRQLQRLANERVSLFGKSGSNYGLSNEDQQRLSVIEREIDECFLARRRLQADLDARRFDREDRLRRDPRLHREQP